MKKIVAVLGNRYFLYAIFWGYNSVYLLFMGFVGISRLTLLSSVTATIPWNVAVMGYVLVLTPITAILIGLFTRLRNEPKKLIHLFFCVEIPLIFLALIRIIFIRQLTPILWYFTLGGIVSAAGVLFFLFQEKAKNKAQQILQTLSQEIALLLVGYGVLIVVFFFPIILAFLYHILSKIELKPLFALFVLTKGLAFFSSFFFLLLFILTIGFFLAAPVVTTLLYHASFKKSFHHLREIVGSKRTRNITVGFAVVYVLVGFFLSVQPKPNNAYVTRLEQIQAATTFAEKQELAKPLIKEKEAIRRELRHAYLAQYGYLGDATTDIIEEGYAKQLNLDAKRADTLQKAFNTIALPFIYRGTFREDVKIASERYEEIFDASIQEGERKYIVDALKSTNTRDPLKAGLLNKEAQNVRVVKQDIQVTTHNNTLATVSIEEEYENTSEEIQEVYYEFSLPAEAVITDLRLGSDLEYIGTIAPKGAARRTYENQVRVRRDPALLEQIGPRQYKLRVFPIPAKPLIALAGNTTNEGKHQRVKFEYVVSDLSKGIPLPVFGETRNVYSDKKTVRIYDLNGQRANYGETSQAIAATEKTACPTTALQFTLPTTPAGTIFFFPHSANPALKDVYHCGSSFSDTVTLPKGKKLALLLDASASNDQMDWNVYLKETFPTEQLLANQNTIDLYYFNETISDKIPLTSETLQKDVSVISFGKTARLQALQALPPDYDAAIMITDESSFEVAVVGKMGEKSLIKNFPVYLVHPKGTFPAYTDELTHQIIMSRGGVFADPQEALRELAHTDLLTTQTSASTTIISMDEEGTWLLVPSGTTDTLSGIEKITTTQDDPSNKIAAGILTNHLQRNHRPINEIHEVATSASIVTPYSSFIALVDAQQRLELERAKKQANAFQADFDTGVEQLPQGQSALTVGAVPEPEEWLLLALSIGLLLFFSRHRLLAVVRR